MTEVPREVWDTLNRVLTSAQVAAIVVALADSIQANIDEEREACALLVEEHARMWAEAVQTASQLAAAIRAREK